MILNCSDGKVGSDFVHSCVQAHMFILSLIL